MKRSRKKLGRNDPCWCDSGVKYKKCHLDREKQSKPGKKEIGQRFLSAFNKGFCLHPKASPRTCSRKIISAHTIQRNGDLDVIAKNGHVYSIIKHGPMFGRSILHGTSSTANKVGVKKASKFRGFCSKHDNELFAPIEKKTFRATTEQIALLGYRAVCYELFMKKCLLRLDPTLRDMDKGHPISDQLRLQNALDWQYSGAKKGLEEITLHKTSYEDMLLNNNFANLGYYVVVFASAPEMVCSGSTQATHNFLGNKIADLVRLDVPVGSITLSLIATDEGGAAVFTWPSNHSGCHNVMMTFNGLSGGKQPHAIVRFTFDFFENTYISPEWWDGLDKRVQDVLIERQQREILNPITGLWPLRPDDCLLDDGVRAVNWKVLSRLTSLK